ncbi:MAG: hypothetical protein IJC83_00235 [Oscillospiraceae bacterium]|nr:hypothetical protein [Oscillospiraceae bacterium]
MKNSVVTRYRFTLNASLFFVSATKIVLLFFGIFLFINPASPDIFKTTSSLCICFLAFNIALVFSPSVIKLVQKYLGTKANLMRAILLLAVGTMGLASSPNLIASCIFAVITALSVGYKKPAFMLFSISEKEIENEQTRKEMQEYAYAGVVLGVVLGIAGIMFLQMRGILFVLFLMLIFCAVLNLIFIKDTIPKEERLISYPIISAKKVFSDGAFAFLKNIFLDILLGFLGMMIIFLVPLCLLAISDYSVLPWNIGILVAFIILANRFKSVFKTISQKHNTKAVFFINSIILGLCYLLFMLAKSSVLGLIGICLLVSFTTSGLYVVKRVLSTESLSPSAKDAETSILTQTRSIGAVLAVLCVYLTFLSADKSAYANNLSLLGLICAIVAIFSGIFVLTAYRTPKE